jgi:hypothetical protein
MTRLDEQESNQSRQSSGVELLDRGIRRDYVRSQLFGPYEIWERKPERARDAEMGYDSTP